MAKNNKYYHYKEQADLGVNIFKIKSCDLSKFKKKNPDAVKINKHEYEEILLWASD
jgi:hypothetical protein